MTVTQDEEIPIPASGLWDLIWDRFAAELTSLVSLDVEESEFLRFRERVRSGSRYIRWLAPQCYRIPKPVRTDGGANAAALERFRMTVASRSEEAKGGSAE